MRNTKIQSPSKMTVTFNPIRGFNDNLAAAAGGYAYAEQMLNMSASDGRLIPCEGFKLLTDEYVYPRKVIKKCFLYKKFDLTNGADNRVIIYCGDGKLYQCPLSGGTFEAIDGISFSAAPSGVCYNYNGENVMIFSKSGGGIYIYDGTDITEVTDAPEITSMCVHFERLFVTTGGNDNALWFSDDFDPCNWNVSLSEAGFINMNDFKGELIKVVSFGDYLYAFKTFGITRISAYTDQTSFSATDLFVSSGKIYKDSIVVCGDCMIFVASDGIYRFDGVSAQKISEAFEKRINFDYEYFKGIYYNGNAYMRVSAKVDGVYTVQIMKLNPKTAEATFIRGVKLSDFMLVDCDGNYKMYGAEAGLDKLCVLTPNECKIFGQNMNMVWENGESDFGVPLKKTLTKFTVYANKPITVGFLVDGKKYGYADVSGAPISLRPNLNGVNFQLRFEANDPQTVISSPVLTLEYYV